MFILENPGGARKYFISPGAAYLSIRRQPAFKYNLGSNIRRLIRQRIPYMRSYYMERELKSKWKYAGDYWENTVWNNVALIKLRKDGIISRVKRMSENTLTNICRDLNFCCPYCGNSKPPEFDLCYHYLVNVDATLICDDCRGSKLKIVREELKELTRLVNILSKGEISHEKYIGITQGFDRGFVGFEGRSNKPLGSAGESLCGEANHRYIESRDSGECNVAGEILTSFIGKSNKTFSSSGIEKSYNRRANKIGPSKRSTSKSVIDL